MKALSFLIFLVLVLASCTGKYALKKEIKLLESQLSKDQNFSDSILEPLLISYTNYINNYPEDRLTPYYLYKIGSIYIRMQNWSEAAKHFEYVIDRFNDADVYPESILLAAYSNETLRANNEERSAELYKLYIDKFPNGPGIQRANFYFQPEDVKIRSRISDYQNLLYGDNGALNRNNALILVQQYMNFVRKYRQNNFSPNYCFEGGKLASTIGESADALEFWLIILEEYPDYRLYPETMLLYAVECETKMPQYAENYTESDTIKIKRKLKIDRFDIKNTNWTKEAERMYRKILELYPNQEIAEQAKASLKHLGKSPNEVVMSFINSNVKK